MSKHNTAVPCVAMSCCCSAFCRDVMLLQYPVSRCRAVAVPCVAISCCCSAVCLEPVTEPKNWTKEADKLFTCFPVRGCQHYAEHHTSEIALEHVSYHLTSVTCTSLNIHLTSNTYHWESPAVQLQQYCFLACLPMLKISLEIRVQFHCNESFGDQNVSDKKLSTWWGNEDCITAFSKFLF